jgi:hypothetical protein
MLKPVKDQPGKFEDLDTGTIITIGEYTEKLLKNL